jgi:Holliday junction DNA helicase RuvA
MIAQLTGLVAAREDGRCVIDVNGVGYLVHASTRTLAALPDRATVFTEMQVREDAITLYGFAEAEERDWFRLLMTVQGVGGKVALNILSTLSPRDLAAAIASGDKASLGRASGVGPKLAMRLATELRDKAGALPTGPGLALPAAALRSGSPTAEAVSALTNLGYRRPEAEAAIARISDRLGPDAPLDRLIRDGLQDLAR